MSTEPVVQMTSEQLVLSVTKGAEGYIRHWYETEDAKFVMKATDRGKQAFTWEGFYRDGTVIRQYDEVAFYRVLVDKDYVPPQDRLVSTGALDKKKTVRFVLHPIAMMRTRCPWFVYPYVVSIRPEVGERLLAFWEVDYRPRDGFKIFRTAIGIQTVDPTVILDNGDEKELSRSVLVFSPSGSNMLAGTTNVSFEGE